jgi:hypothetical protein
MPTRDQVTELLDGGDSFEQGARVLGVPPGQAYMIATGRPADDGDAPSPATGSESAHARQLAAAGWQLAELAGVVANGGVDEHLDGMQRLGLLTAQPGAPPVWHPVRPRPELGSAVRRLLVVLSDQNDEPAARASRADVGSRVLAVEAAVRTTKRCVRAAGDELDAATAAEVIQRLDQIEGHLQAARRCARR